MVHVMRIYVYGGIIQCSGHGLTSHQSMYTYHGKKMEYGSTNYSVISQERLKIEIMLLLSANKKSYMLRRLARYRMTLSDFEWPFNPHRG